MSKEFLFKILLCGDGAVGKTSIRNSYMGQGFSGSYMKTIGADFASHAVQMDGNKITFQIFDLAGQDAYRVARKSFYKGGQASFLIFDLQDSETLRSCKRWVEDSINNSEGSIGTFIALGNKADLVDTRQVSNEMAIEYFQRLSVETGITFVFLETSAMTGLNIELAFNIMGTRLLRKHNIDVPLELPDGVELITPSSAPAQAAAPVAAAPAANVDLSGITSRLDELDNRLALLEERFGKLAQIVRQLVDN
ncbi:MAG: GTP-binding protein [Candidatus Heimdallarchaeota archaeon]|nr:GTP-binding protein [Candidatus Heimdallarchaeota archaeon]